MRSYLLILCILLTIFLTFQQVFALNASELADQLNAELKSGKVLAIMKWDGKKVLTYDVENDIGDFKIEPGKAYYVLTDLKGVEFIDMPFSHYLNISKGWNLVTWSDNIQSYNPKQITCFDPVNQKYFTIIPGFNDAFIPEGLGCWVLVDTNRVENETPCVIYGEVRIDGKKTNAIITVIDNENQNFDIIETDGKFAIELLNLQWLPGDNITLHVQKEKMARTLTFKPESTPYRVDIELQSYGYDFWYIILLMFIFVIIFILTKKRKKYEK